MALTLLEAAKLHSGDVVRSTIIELFAEKSDLMRAMQWSDIDGNAYRYNQEEALPGISFRGVNEAYPTQTVGVVNPETEHLVIAGGDLDVDTFIIKTMGMGQRAVREAMKVKALAHQISHKFIKGDSASDPREFDGLQKRLIGNQVVSNGASSGGDPLSLAKLDELIDQVEGANALYMNKGMRRRLTAAARNTSVGGYIRFDQDEFGRTQMFYNDLPILIADGGRDLFATLAFDEAATGGGSTATSIYCLAIGEGQFSGIQNGVMDVRDLGEMESTPAFRTRVEWFVAPLLEDPKAAARLRDISNAAATA